MSDSTRAAIGNLAEPDLIELADAATDDLSDAAAFADERDLGRLGAAVAAASGSRRERGAAALAAFLRYRAAADGIEVDSSTTFTPVAEAI